MAIYPYNLCLWMAYTAPNLILLRVPLDYSSSSFQFVLPLIFVLSPVIKMRCYSLPYCSVLNYLSHYSRRPSGHVSRLRFPAGPAVLSIPQCIPKVHEKHCPGPWYSVCMPRYYLFADTLGPRPSSFI